MDTKVVWSDLVPPKEGVKNPINDVAYSPDGTRIVVGVWNRVLLYHAEKGDLLNTLKGHKGTVTSVAWSHDGTRFASGGMDSVVVIWKNTGVGMMKYSHQSPIRKIAFNPTAMQLASCSEGDFGLWAPGQKAVTKEKVSSKVLSVAWALTGDFIALGLESGQITIRNQQADEIMTIDKKAPVWCLAFIPALPVTKSASTDGDIMVVGCWDKTLSTYKITGTSSRIQSERSLKYYPCSMTIAGENMSKSSYIVIAGSNNKVVLYSRDGLRLAELLEKESWVWSVSCHPGSDRIVVGSDDGSIDNLEMAFNPVHAIYMDRYAYRENLTEVVVQHLITDRKVRIKCRDLVQKLSLYRNKLAVQLTDKTCIYESNTEDTFDMHFRLRRERIAMDVECDHMVVTSNHIVYANEKNVSLYTFDGKRLRMWNTDSNVIYMRIDGGPENKEGVFLGLEDGSVLKIMIMNSIAMNLFKQESSAECVDASLYRGMLAIVDKNKKLNIIDTKSRNVIHSIDGVNSVCFNSEVDDMLCYSDNKAIYVLSGLGSDSSDAGGIVNEPKGQYLLGDAMGFHGQKIFCLHQGKVNNLDVPQGPNMLRALSAGDIKGAYRVACLGATDEEWKILAMAALNANELNLARNSFARLKDARFLDLIDEIDRSGAGKSAPALTTERSERRGRNSALSSGPKAEVKQPLNVAWKAESLAYEGHHMEAAKLYAKNNLATEAVRLLADLRMYDEAKSYAHNAQVDISNLNLQQAKWLEDIHDSKGAAKLFLSMNENMQAAKVLAEAKQDGWVQALYDVVQVCMKDEKAVLLYCGEIFSKENCDNEAKETYLKLGDLSKLMEFYTKREMWSEAAQLAEEYDGAFDSGMFQPYAEWLLAQDRYEDAMKAYKKAGRKDLARKVLEELTMNAVVESRFKDAAYYYWLLSKDADGEDQIAQYESEHKADLYFAYASVHSFVTDPFTSQQPEMLFQVSRFIINSLGNSGSIPHGISKAATLFTLGRQAMSLGAFKLARHTFDRLSKLQLPHKKQQEIEHDMLIVQAKPVRDDPSHAPVCYRCGSTNPLLNPFTNKFAKGDVCTNCGHPFVRSFISFDILPLVEFVPNPSISDEEAIDLIRQSPGEGKSGRSSGWSEGKVGDADTMTFDAPSTFDDDFAPGGGDLFTRNLNAVLESQGNATSYIPVMLDASALSSIKRSEVFVCRPSSKEKRATFYKNMLPEIAIAISQPCHRFFHLEDFEFSYLSNKSCPYSRLKNVGEYGSL